MGKIPVDGDKMGPSKVYNLPDRPQFRKVEYKKFRDNLNRLRTGLKKKKKQANEDAEYLAQDRKLKPKPTHNHRGEPRYEGSETEYWLKIDIASGHHLGKAPKDLYKSREVYLTEGFTLKTFREHIHQEVRAVKFQNYVKWKQDKGANWDAGSDDDEGATDDEAST